MNESSYPNHDHQSHSGQSHQALFGKRLGGVFEISGIVHVIRQESELAYFREGEILVAQRIDPNWSEQLKIAKAVIEDASADDSQAGSIIERFNLPGIIGVEGAVETLRLGNIVTLRGDGEIEMLSEKRASDSPMRVSVPDAVEARDIEDTSAPNVVLFTDVKYNRTYVSGDVEDIADLTREQQDANKKDGSRS